MVSAAPLLSNTLLLPADAVERGEGVVRCDRKHGGFGSWSRPAWTPAASPANTLAADSVTVPESTVMAPVWVEVALKVVLPEPANVRAATAGDHRRDRAAAVVPDHAFATAECQRATGQARAATAVEDQAGGITAVAQRQRVACADGNIEAFLQIERVGLRVAGQRDTGALLHHARGSRGGDVGGGVDCESRNPSCRKSRSRRDCWRRRNLPRSKATTMPLVSVGGCRRTPFQYCRAMSRSTAAAAAFRWRSA